MATVDGSHTFRTPETSPSAEVQAEPYLVRRDTTNDHPLKDVGDDELEAITKYAMMPKGVALAAFSRSSFDTTRNANEDRVLEIRKREESTVSLESLDLELPPLEAYKVETGNKMNFHFTTMYFCIKKNH